MFKDTIDFIRGQFNTDAFIPLHEPRFIGNEKKYLNDCIDSTFVSSVGAYVDKFEKDLAEITGAKYAVAIVNGTAALQVGLRICGVEEGDEVITQPLTFIATCNAISYLGAHSVFVDVDKDTLGLGYKELKKFLEEHTSVKDGVCYNNTTGRKISACVPMHSFGFPCDIEGIAKLCESHHIAVIEDSAESLGSYVGEKHTGLFGKVGAISFNGNKVITCGGGGAIITDDEDLAKMAKHLTTTAKIPHKWEYRHDYTGYNYRMPNLNAALACAQLEQLEKFLNKKRALADKYKTFYSNKDINFLTERAGTTANYWLMTVVLKDRSTRDQFLEETNSAGVMTRPAWTLMNKLDMYKDAFCGDLSNSEWAEDRVVNISSSVII